MKNRRNKMERTFCVLVKFIAFLAVSILSLILIFILKESMGVFSKVSFISFIFGTEWQPLNSNKVGIMPFLLSTLYVSFIAILIAMPIGIGFSIFMSILVNQRLKYVLKAFVNMLAGIPSVIYGFIGLSVIVKFFEKYLSFSTGESVFCAAILLSIMILPYIVSSCDETMSRAYEKYEVYSKALGVSKWYMINNLILPVCKKSILCSTILATARAMGETMAVMMVIGNSPIMPTLFGKGETIPALIALEMGSAQIGSLHYHGLFATGLVLMLLILVINIIFYNINRKIQI